MRGKTIDTRSPSAGGYCSIRAERLLEPQRAPRRDGKSKTRQATARAEAAAVIKLQPGFVRTEISGRIGTGGASMGRGLADAESTAGDQSAAA